MTPPIELTPIRGGREVGPVALVVETGDCRVLLDCGSSGRGAADWARELGDVDAVWVSHAHVDHCGALPELVDGRPHLDFVCSPGTERLVAYALAGHPACDRQRAVDITEGFRTPPVRSWFEIPRGGAGASIRAMAFPAGHILGASMILLEIGEEPTRILYTGDFCCHDQPFVRGAAVPKPGGSFEIDVFVMEGILATNARADAVDYDAELGSFVEWVGSSDGGVLVAAQPVGEAIELATALAADGLEVSVHEELGPIVDAYRRSRPDGWDLTRASEERLRGALAEGGIVVAPGDQLGAGTAARRLVADVVGREDARIALANRAYTSTLAGALLAAEPGDEVEDIPGASALRASVRRFDLPAHSPRWQLVETVRSVDPGKVVLIHGSKSGLFALRRAVKEAGYSGPVEVPECGDSLEISA